MYESFFQFNYRPFAIPPDADCIFWTEGHREAFSVIEVGLGRLSQVTVLTGGIGTGKTTLIRHLLRTTAQDYSVGLLSNFSGGRGDLLSWLLAAYGQDISGASEAVLFERLERYLVDQLDRGRRSILIIDEAQNLSTEDLENLHLLSNVNADDVLLMLILVGQPQLRAKLTRAENRHVCQSIAADYHLEALTPADTKGYILFRCTRAGGAEDLFDDAALDEIHRISRGVPRKINVLCDLALIAAYAEGIPRVSRDVVCSVMEDARRHGTYSSLTEHDIATVAERDLAVGAEEDAASSAPSTPEARDPLQQLSIVVDGDGNRKPRFRSAGPGRSGRVDGRSVAQGPDPADAVFGLPGWPADALLFIDDPQSTKHEAQPSSTPAISASGPDEAVRPSPASEKALPGTTDPAAQRGVPADLPDTDLPDEPALAGRAAELQPTAHRADGPRLFRPARRKSDPPSENLWIEQPRVTLRREGSPQGGRKSARRVRNFAASGSLVAGLAVLALAGIAAVPDEDIDIARLVGLADGQSPGTTPPGSPANPEVLASAGAASAIPDADGARPSNGRGAGRAPAPAVAETAESQPPPPADRLSDLAPVAPAGWHSPEPDADGLRGREPSSPDPKRRGVASGLSAATPVPAPAIRPLETPGERAPVRFAPPFELREPSGPREQVPAVADGDVLPGLAPAQAVARPAVPGPIPTISAVAKTARLRGEASTPAPLEAAEPSGAPILTDTADSRSFKRTDVQLAALSAAPAPLRDGRLPTAPSIEPEPTDGADAPPAIEAAAPGPVTRPVMPTEGTPAANAEAIFRHALDIALDEPTAAIAAYARAAMMGHERAAYYLGQIYETGDGVPVDFALARHWYKASAAAHKRADARLKELPRAETEGVLAAPIPLLAQPSPDGQVDFVWTSGQGADPASYIVELAADPGRGAMAAHHLSGSAARLPLAPGASHWRVLAIDVVGGRYAVSGWQPIGGGEAAEPAHPLPGSAGVRPSITIAYSGADAAAAAELRASLQEIGIPAQLAEAMAPPAVSSVRYFYGQDAAAAGAIAELLPGAITASMLDAEVSEGDAPLPGQVLVTLGSL